MARSAGTTTVVRPFRPPFMFVFVFSSLLYFPIRQVRGRCFKAGTNKAESTVVARSKRCLRRKDSVSAVLWSGRDTSIDVRVDDVHSNSSTNADFADGFTNARGLTFM